MSRNFDLSQIDNFTAFAYDHVQQGQPNAGARIAKINAEQHMCGVIIRFGTWKKKWSPPGRQTGESHE